MKQIRAIAEIESRIRQVEEKLEIINDGISKQLALSFYERSQGLCLFLSTEKKIYTALLNELKWMLNE